jgi:putative heme-binding domain-containing protein
LQEQVLALAGDPDARVRFRVALALGASHDPRAAIALTRIARQDGTNRWTRAAVLSSCVAFADRLLVDLWQDLARPMPNPDQTARAELLSPLAEIVGARNRPEEVGRVLDALAAAEITPGTAFLGLRDGLVMAMARGSRRSGGPLSVDTNSPQPGARLVARRIERARTTALAERAPESERIQALAALSALDPSASSIALRALLEPRQPVAVQVAAVQSLTEVRTSEADIAGFLLGRLRAFEPAVRAAAVRTLLSRAAWTKALLQAAEKGGAAGGISPGLIDPADRAPLLKHRDPEIARLAQALFTRTAASARAGVIVEYLTALRQKGDTARGAKVFERECQSCHKVGDRGFKLGPDLTGSPSSDPTALVANILDPNANVTPEYIQYLIVDHSGRTYSGIIAAETPTSLTLRRATAAEDAILRTQIAELTSTGLSLMPEGFEKTIGKPEMADLVAFLRAAHRGGDEDTADDNPSRPLDIGTLPGLIEPDE